MGQGSKRNSNDLIESIILDGAEWQRSSTQPKLKLWYEAVLGWVLDGCVRVKPYHCKILGETDLLGAAPSGF